MKSFTDLNLDKKIQSNLAQKGYGQPTPIQEQSIPYILEGKDLLGIAQTGTGKTAAFALPTISNLIANNKPCGKKGVRALILSPTRELASQIADNIKSYSKGLNLRYLTIFGGVSIHNQIKHLSRGTDILIATPGRLIDLINRRAIDISGVETLILDEADRMLDMGFIGDIRKIAAKTPGDRQTILFSATMPSNITNLAESLLRDPIRVEVAKESTTAEKIDQKVYFVDKGNKPELLKHVLQSEEMEHVLVFSKTKYGADRIAKRLEDESIKSAAIHGNKTQSARERTLKRFREGKIKVLIATDIAARGIDVSTITHVINYDLPQDPESYVHRIGRTARAGRKGHALTFCDKSEINNLKAVEKTINLEIAVDNDQPYHDDSLANRKSKSGSSRSKPRKISSGSSRNSSRSEGGFKRRDSGDSRRSEGGFNRRDSGDSRRSSGDSRRSSGDSRRSEGSFNRRDSGDSRRSSGDSRRSEGSFNRRDSGDSRRSSGDSRRSEGSFNRRDSGDSRRSSDDSRRSEGGFNRRDSGDSRRSSGDSRRSSGDYRRSSGDSRRSEGSFNRRDSGDSRRSEGGFNRRDSGDSRRSSNSSRPKSGKKW